MSAHTRRSGIGAWVGSVACRATSGPLRIGLVEDDGAVGTKREAHAPDFEFVDVDTLILGVQLDLGDGGRGCRIDVRAVRGEHYPSEAAEELDERLVLVAAGP